MDYLTEHLDGFASGDPGTGLLSDHFNQTQQYSTKHLNTTIPNLKFQPSTILNQIFQPNTTMLNQIFQLSTILNQSPYQVGHLENKWPLKLFMLNLNSESPSSVHCNCIEAQKLYRICRPSAKCRPEVTFCRLQQTMIWISTSSQ